MSNHNNSPRYLKHLTCSVDQILDTSMSLRFAQLNLEWFPDTHSATVLLSHCKVLHAWHLGEKK